MAYTMDVYIPEMCLFILLTSVTSQYRAIQEVVTRKKGCVHEF